jgi:uncharacterized membrane protein
LTNEILFYVFLLFILLIILSFNFIVGYFNKINSSSENIAELKSELIIFRTILIVLLIVAPFFYYGWPVMKRIGWDNHILEWFSLVVRWTHVVLGIAWIGASFYFIFLENSLNRTKDLRDELAGNLWAIHGGGFYYIEKYKGAPGKIPENLHWFKYEAYFTWLTGIILLIFVYYLNAKSFMVDPAVSDIDAKNAILLGSISLVAGWFIYDVLCRTPLLSRPRLFGAVGFALLVLISFVLSHYLSGRAAFMHVGALLGTIMAGNVFFVIIPSQKSLVRAAQKNLPPDYELAKISGLRSLHNNYITLPVVFVMISNHFPATFAPVYNWSILAVLTLGSVAVRHYINLHEKGISSPRFLAYGAIALFVLVYVTSPVKRKINTTPVNFSEAQTIITKRCLSCHSTNPTDEVEKIAPNGVILETPEQIFKYSDRILFRVVQTKTMPQGNKTGITEEEREVLGRWIEQGSPIK